MRSHGLDESNMLIFRARDIEKVKMGTAIELMREAFQLLSEGNVQVPLRTSMMTADNTGMALFMPSYAPVWKLFGLKMVTVFGKNAPPIPSIQGQMLVMDAENGKLLALLDAPAVTALRTGAASGLATQMLANPDASTLAVFGTGVQAWTQIAGVLAVRKITRIMMKGTSGENERAFSKRVTDHYRVSCEPLGDVANLKHADIICTATNAEQPLFELNHLRAGVHINAIGSYTASMREVSEGVIRKSLLVADQRAAVLHEAGEVAIPVKEGRMTSAIIHAELGELVSGKQGRSSPGQVTIFKSVGNAIQDLAVARHLLKGVS